jgi:hypothetical protein
LSKTKNRKPRKPTERQRRLAKELEAKQERERAKETDLSQFGAHVPTSLQIPTKTSREGLQQEADLETEFFGGFRQTKVADPDKIDDVVEPGVWRKSGRGKWRRRVEPSAWLRRWGYVDITVDRFVRDVAWPRKHWPKAWRRRCPCCKWFLLRAGPKAALQRAPRRWAAPQPSNGAYPFILKKEIEHEAHQRGRDAAKQRQFEQAINFNPEREKAEHQERMAERETALDEPYGKDKHRYARGIYHLEYREMLAQHTERRIQALKCRHYKPSKALELKRFPQLARVETKLWPREHGRGLGYASLPEWREAQRRELDQLVTAYSAFVAPPTACPPETTTRMLDKMRKKRPVGRPTVFDRAMTSTERSRRRRSPDKTRILTATPPGASDARRSRRPRVNLARVDLRGSKNHNANRKTAR